MTIGFFKFLIILNILSPLLKIFFLVIIVEFLIINLGKFLSILSTTKKNLITFPKFFSQFVATTQMSTPHNFLQ